MNLIVQYVVLKIDSSLKISFKRFRSCKYFLVAKSFVTRYDLKYCS